jgi:hypothetical protein
MLLAQHAGPHPVPSSQAPIAEEQAAVTQSRDLIEDVFTNTAASVILKVFQVRCEYDETFRMEYMEPVGSQPNCVFADENQPARRQEMHARVNSQDLSRKQFLSRHRKIIALMTPKDATKEEQHVAWSRHFGETFSQDHRALLKACVNAQCHAKVWYLLSKCEVLCLHFQLLVIRFNLNRGICD